MSDQAPGPCSIDHWKGDESKLACFGLRVHPRGQVSSQLLIAMSQCYHVPENPAINGLGVSRWFPGMLRCSIPASQCKLFLLPF